MTAKRSQPAARWLIASGDFFFKHRNALFPAVILVVALGMRPRLLWNDPTLDSLLGWWGVAAALLGEAIRLATIGFEYIERGGKNKQVWASRLVRGGIYGLSRNPMYVGNILIVIGMCLIARAPLAYVTIIPLFFYIYSAIVATEENFLRNKFGREFEDYCLTVPRFIPHFRDFRRLFKGARYDWKRALRQDLSTLVGVLFGVALFPAWRVFWLEGFASLKPILPQLLAVALTILGFYGFILSLKKARKLE